MAFASIMASPPEDHIIQSRWYPRRPPGVNELPDLGIPGPPYATWLRSEHGVGEHAVPVEEGSDIPEGNRAYVGRGYYHGMLLPASVLPGCVSRRGCIVTIHPVKARAAWMGVQVEVKEVEVLVVRRTRCEWVAASDGDVPAHALPACTMTDGDTAFAARGFIGNDTVFGRVVAKDGACIAPYHGREVALKNYEVLTIM